MNIKFLTIIGLPLTFLLACGDSTKESNEDSNEEPSCATKPNTGSVIYSCDSQETTGQCVDYLAWFDTSTMDITCNALEGTAAEGTSCQESPTHVGSCCVILNEQWYVTHYSASELFSAEELQSNCDNFGGVWYP